MLSKSGLLVALLAVGVSAFVARPRTRNDGIHLAVGPSCGRADGAPADVNAGLRPLRDYKTIVSFGDSYTAGGNADGGPLLPPVLTGTSPKAGGRTTNGRVWNENVARDIGALYMDYAGNASDFVHQAALFLSQNHTLAPATTLYTVFFGINDISASNVDGPGNALPAARVVLAQIALLMRPPTNARHFLVADDYGRGTVVPAGETYKAAVFAGLREMGEGFRYAFVDFKTIWDGVLGADPGFREFGYASAGACLPNSTTVEGACSDPDHTFYWIPGHPSKQTHRIMADYTELVLSRC
ncbi:hypothetical protein AURDEDRAFT_143931 [Auricularia subglabra TFB-10046 SS5]|nr:hypothetical protein AURDEDRAFT_143931 [Auricularia subglabra TFB-10046 SS5]